MIVIIGILLLFSSAFVLCRMAYLFYDRKLCFYNEFIVLLYFLRQKMSSSSVGISRILEEISGTQTLREIGLIENAITHGLYISYCQNEDKIVIDDEDKDMLRGFFSELGSNMLSAEIENITRCVSRLEQKYEQVRRDTPSKKKVSGTVIICSALLAIILIL